MDLIGAAQALLSDTKSVSRPSAAEPTPAIFGQGGTITKQMPRNAKAFMGVFAGANAVDWAADAGDYWAGTVSSAPIYAERDGKRLKRPHDDPEGEYPGGDMPLDLELLLTAPNPFQTWQDLTYLHTIDMLFAGEAFWLRYQLKSDGRPMALYRLNPAYMDVIPGVDAPIAGYEYRIDGVPTPVKYSPAEIIHFRLPNPHSNTRGLGIIARQSRVFDMDIALVETMAQFFEQGAKLAGVLQSDRSVPDPVYKKIQRQFSSLYSGSRNAYKIAVLERGLTFQSIQPTAVDAQFEALGGLSRDRIAAMFGMHPVLLGSDETRPGILDEAQQQFDTKKVRPYLDRMQALLTVELGAAWGLKLCIDYQYTLPEQARLTLATVYGTLPGVKVREVREYVGLAPLGDDRDDIVLNLPGLGVEAGGTPTGAMPGPEGGRPANPNNLAAFPGGPQGEQPSARYKAVEAALEPYRDAPRAERAEALSDVASLEWPADSRAARGRVIAHVAEGIRRGYTIDQVLYGNPDEQFGSLVDTIMKAA